MLLFCLSIISVGILSSELAFAAPLPSHTPPDSPSTYIDLHRFHYTADDYEARQRGTVISRSSSLDRPSSLVDRPPSLLDRPPSLLDRPSSLLDRPPSLLDRPSSLLNHPSSLNRPSSSVRYRTPSPQERDSGSGDGEGPSQIRGAGNYRRGRPRREGPGALATRPNSRRQNPHYQNMTNQDRNLILSNTLPHRDLYNQIDRETFTRWLGRVSNDDYQQRLSSTNRGVVRAAMQEIITSYLQRPDQRITGRRRRGSSGW